MTIMMVILIFIIIIMTGFLPEKKVKTTTDNYCLSRRKRSLITGYNTDRRGDQGKKGEGEHEDEDDFNTRRPAGESRVQ